VIDESQEFKKPVQNPLPTFSKHRMRKRQSVFGEELAKLKKLKGNSEAVREQRIQTLLQILNQKKGL